MDAESVDVVSGMLVLIMYNTHILLYCPRKAIQTIWKLPFRTHYNTLLLHVINNTLPIDVMLEQSCINLIWRLLHSPKLV